MIKYLARKPEFVTGFRQQMPSFVTEQAGNTYLSSLCKKNQYKEAFEAFDLIRKSTTWDIWPSTYAQLINSCASSRSLERGRRIHEHILRSRWCPDIVLQNHILNMYGKCGSLEDARRMFDEMPERNVVSYTSVIAGCAQNGKESDSMVFYLEMLRLGLLPDQFTFGSLIKACSGLGDVDLGKQMHCHVVKSEFGSDIIAQDALIAMYTKFNLIDDARGVFCRISEKDLVSWGSMIGGYSQLGFPTEALSHFREMLRQGLYLPNEFIFGSVIGTCSSLLEVDYGRQIHGMCLKLGFGRDIYAGCALCDMYARCGFLDSARDAFHWIESPDIAAWNAIIVGLASSGQTAEALSYFSQLMHTGFMPDETTIRSLLCACNSPLSHGMQVHSCITKMGFGSWTSVCNALITMYAKCCDLCNAFNVFEEMGDCKDLISWNAILTACVQHCQSAEAFRLLKLVLVSYGMADSITITTILGACGEATSIEMGNQIHCYALKSALLLDVSVMNALIDMHAKCGSLASARELFGLIKRPDVVSWSSLIVGYAQSGYIEEALELFKTMINFGVEPNQVTFLGVLTACSHAGLVEEGLHLYRIMETEYGILPMREHFSCVVDLLARAGRLHEAENFINQLSFEPDVVVWKTLLAACKTHGNVDVGERAAEKILRIDPSNSVAHILLCNIYASSGSWKNVARLRNSMKEKGLRKAPGQSWIEVKDCVHVFFAEDVLHPECRKIYTILEELWLQMLEIGSTSRNRTYMNFEYDEIEGELCSS